MVWLGIDILNRIIKKKIENIMVLIFETFFTY